MSSITTGLTQEMSTYYDKRFLERAKAVRVYDVGATQKAIPVNMGKTVSFTRRTPLASTVASAQVTDEVTSNSVDMTSTSVTAAVQTLAKHTTVSALFELTSIDERLLEHIDVHGQNAGETLDTFIKDELDGGGTTQIVNSVALSAVATSDTLDGVEIRKARATLFGNKAPFFMTGPFQTYRAIIPGDVAHDIRGDSEWLDATRYTDAQTLRTGQLGILHGVEFYETNNPELTADAGAGNVDVYTTFIFGKDAYAEIDIGSTSTPMVSVKRPGANSTDNPNNLFSTVGWSAHYAAKVLNSNWLLEVKSASSIGTNS